LFLKVNNYKQTVTIIKDNLLFGVGYNNFRLAQKQYGYISVNDWEQTNAGAGADNSFLFVFATSGILGFFYFIYLQKILLFSLFKNKNYCLFIYLILILISSFSINAFFYPWVLFLFFLLLAKVKVDKEF
jgi:O-antigen ligase